jgi:hypothetical protein
MSKILLLGPMGVRELFPNLQKPQKMHYRGHFSTQNVSQLGNRSDGQLGMKRGPVGRYPAPNGQNRIVIGPPRKILWLFATPKIFKNLHFRHILRLTAQGADCARLPLPVGCVPWYRASQEKFMSSGSGSFKSCGSKFKIFFPRKIQKSAYFVSCLRNRSS